MRSCGQRRLVVAVVVGAFALAGCSNGDGSEGVTTVPIELGDAEGACRAVAQANELMGSPEADEREAGEVLAALVWDRSAADDELSNWLRLQCGADSLDMAYEAGLFVNGRVTGDS